MAIRARLIIDLRFPAISRLYELDAAEVHQASALNALFWHTPQNLVIWSSGHLVIADQ
jgi:hypothetical protein